MTISGNYFMSSDSDSDIINIKQKTVQYEVYIVDDDFSKSFGYESNDMEICLKRDMSKFIKGLEIASSASIGADVLTIISDGNKIVKTISKENATIFEVSLIVALTSIHMFELVKDTIEVLDTLTTIAKIKTVASAFKKIPYLDIIITVATTIIVVTLLVISYNAATTWLQANYIEDSMYETLIDAAIGLIMAGIAFIFPVGTAIAFIYAVIRIVIALGGWEDDIKQFLHNLFGHATGKQAEEAYEKAVEIVDEIIAHKRIQNRLDKEKIIFIPLYPDIEK